MLKLTGLSVSSSVSCSQALFILLQLRSSAHSLFVLLRLQPASLHCFSPCFFCCLFSLRRAPFLALLGCSVSSFSSTVTHTFSLSLCLSLSLSLCPFHLLLAQEENGDLERANTVALDLSSCCAILVVRISRCQPTECRVAKQSSRAAFIVEQPLFPFLHNAPSEQQRQFGNESRLTLLLIQQGNVVGLFQ